MVSKHGDMPQQHQQLLLRKATSMAAHLLNTTTALEQLTRPLYIRNFSQVCQMYVKNVVKYITNIMFEIIYIGRIFFVGQRYRQDFESMIEYVGNIYNLLTSCVILARSARGVGTLTLGRLSQMIRTRRVTFQFSEERR